MKIFGMMFQKTVGPKRIVCLTEEPTEILYALGEGDRIVGISAYTVRPPEAKRDKPVVSAFIGGSVEKICALEPDLVIGFSDIQADLARDLIAANLDVLIFNQRSISEILSVVETVGRIVCQPERADELVSRYVQNLEVTAGRASKRPFRPTVYFEEWDEPAITAIEWVSELIQIAGGDDIFHDRSKGKLAKDRFVSTHEVELHNPDVYLASWCGKPFDKSHACSRFPNGFNAIENQRVYEIDSSIILQPGPACLTDGLAEIESCLWGQTKE